MIDISVIVTGHREGIIVGPTIKSVLRAIDFVEENLNVCVEIITVLDRSDHITKAMFECGFGSRAHIVEVNEGDPGVSRNHGIRIAKGKYISFIDADDLWSYNWLAKAYLSNIDFPGAIWHSECNITFGKESNIWWHIDSENNFFDKNYLDWGNYWDALSFGIRDIYCKFPFRRNDLEGGFGHEDWDWNRLTYTAGIHHKPVLDTIHFKRRRANSQMSRVYQSNSVVRPLKG
jgi:glycosyltransferase involved in cell wall biosynthesis